MNDGPLYQRYRVTHKDGIPVPPKQRFFVLSPDTDPVAKAVVRMYAAAVSETHPRLAASLVETYKLGKTPTYMDNECTVYDDGSMTMAGLTYSAAQAAEMLGLPAMHDEWNRDDDGQWVSAPPDESQSPEDWWAAFYSKGSDVYVQVPRDAVERVCGVMARENRYRADVVRTAWAVGPNPATGRIELDPTTFQALFRASRQDQDEAGAAAERAAEGG